ncbi:MAG: NosD domain-containing protein [Thermoplasmatota archaeon]
MQGKNRAMVVVMAICLAAASLTLLMLNNGYGPLGAEAAGNGTMLYVGGSGPGNYSSIQAAVDAASSGNTIFVHSGIYYENVVIGKTLNLVGEDRDTTIIDGGGSGDVVNVTADGVTITGFTVQNSGPGWPYAGIILAGVQHCRIENNTASSNYAGIHLNVSRNCTIIGNTANNNSWDGIRLTYSQSNTVTNNTVTNNTWYGIYLLSSSGNTISGTSASNNNFGILLFLSNNCTVTGTTAYNNNRGIYLFITGGNTIADTTVINNDYGIYIYSTRSWHQSSGNTVTGTSASNNDYGILLNNTNNNAITDNTIHNNVYSIVLDNSSNNAISNNTIRNNSRGIEQGYNSSSNSITNNTISGGWSAIVLDGDYNTISRNTIHNQTGCTYAILCYSNHNVITYNHISDVFNGTALWNGNNNTVSHNWYVNNTNFGVCATNTTENNLIYNNYFSHSRCIDEDNNIWNISKTPGVNIISGPYLGGNYWSDYTGLDIDGDGLGDTNIPHGPGDYAPLTETSELQMAEEIQIGNAAIVAGRHVLVPVNIDTSQNGPIQTMCFDVTYGSAVNLVSIQLGTLTTEGDGWIHMLGSNNRSVTIVTSIKENAIANGSSGVIVYLNFSTKAQPGQTIEINLTAVDIANTQLKEGTAPVKGGVITLLFLGDLNGNGNIADAVDVTMMMQASVGDIPTTADFDLDGNGIPADAVDVTMMLQASVGDLDLSAY